jgi:hypothetical protein
MPICAWRGMWRAEAIEGDGLFVPAERRQKNRLLSSVASAAPCSCKTSGVVICIDAAKTNEPTNSLASDQSFATGSEPESCMNAYRPQFSKKFAGRETSGCDRCLKRLVSAGLKTAPVAESPRDCGARVCGWRRLGYLRKLQTRPPGPATKYHCSPFRFASTKVAIAYNRPKFQNSSTTLPNADSPRGGENLESRALIRSKPHGKRNA